MNTALKVKMAEPAKIQRKSGGEASAGVGLVSLVGLPAAEGWCW